MENNKFLLMTDTELECIYGGSVSEASYELLRGFGRFCRGAYELMIEHGRTVADSDCAVSVVGNK